MTARNFLISGLLAGLLAGFAAFLVAYTVGEPSVETAIGLESSAAAPGEQHAEGTPAHSHDEEDAVVSRSTQRTWGLLTGTLAVGTALGGIMALVAAGLMGRLGRLSPGQSTAVVSLIGFVAVALVPFLKYPSTPPAVGSGDTIGDRTTSYFVFLLISVLAAVAATALAQRLWRQRGAYVAVVAGGASYLIVMLVAGSLMPTVNELGDFPADTLWYFRRASIATLAALWAVLGVLLTGFVMRLHHQDSRIAARRELAASI